jgi:hypothetical protein
MDEEKKKYDEIINLLRKSSPQFNGKKEIEDKIMHVIETGRQKADQSETFFDYLFWWVNIGWVRKSLVIASVLIVIIFGYQQTIILKRLSDLSRQPVVNDSRMFTYTSLTLKDDYLLNINNNELNPGKMKISDRRIKKLLKSYKEITEKYKELQKIIEEDPQLKKYLEDNLYTHDDNKIKL